MLKWVAKYTWQSVNTPEWTAQVKCMCGKHRITSIKLQSHVDLDFHQQWLFTVKTATPPPVIPGHLHPVLFVSIERSLAAEITHRVFNWS